MDRVPPQNIDAERAVLGAMMMAEGGTEAVETVLSAGLGDEDFYRDAHKEIYSAICALFDRGEPADLLTVTKELERMGKLKEVSDVGYLDEMIDSVPTTKNVEYYAGMVKDEARRRSIIGVAYKVGTAAHGGADPVALLEELQDLISRDETLRSIGSKIPTLNDELRRLTDELCSPRGSEFLGMRTGFSKLDKATLGLRGLSVLGGIPGQGKSSIALQLATEIARLNKVPVLFYALEMDRSDLEVKILSRLSGLDYETLMIGSKIDGRRGQGLTPEDTTKLTTAMGELSKYAERVKLIDRAVCPNISLPVIRLHVQQARRDYNADRVFVVIDHLQIFPCDKPGLDNMKSRLDYLVAEFKAISVQYNATVLLISEKNRDSYDKEWLGAFMGTAGIEYGVDLAMLLHEQAESEWVESVCVKCKKKFRRPADLPEGDRDLSLKFVKSRFGPKAEIRMRFCPDISEFTEAE